MATTKHTTDNNLKAQELFSFKNIKNFVTINIFTDLLSRLVLIEVAIKLHNLLGLFAQGQDNTDSEIEFSTKTYAFLDSIFREILFLCLTKLPPSKKLTCSRVLVAMNIKHLYLAPSNGLITVGIRSFYEVLYFIMTLVCTFLVAFEIKNSFFSEQTFIKDDSSTNKIFKEPNSPPTQEIFTTTTEDEDDDTILTVLEIKEFQKGIPVMTSDDGDISPEQIPYDKKLEISPIQLTYTIDEDNKYYEGFYGVSYKGMLRCQQPKTKTPVCIKLVKEDSNKKDFKGFLMELKMLQFVGKHENLVELIGSCTNKISEGKLQIVTELCENNTLDKFLKQLKLKVHLDENENILDGSIKREIFRWTYEVACGMQYLASKNVVHGSLCTKTIFLTGHKTVKLSEFGIAPYLPKFQNPDAKVAHSSEEINELWPWRNLPWECLLRNNFTIESDVWSYAITTWQILNFAKIPYDQFETFSHSFLESLENGYQPVFQNVPTEARKFLETCLSFHPENRPDFTQVLISMYELTRPKRRKLSFAI